MAEFRKPENALRRAKEYFAAGKKKTAVETLHSVLTARRHRQWTKTHEEIMKEFLFVCVDLRQKNYAREGLHQYRSISAARASTSSSLCL